MGKIGYLGTHFNSKNPVWILGLKKKPFSLNGFLVIPMSDTTALKLIHLEDLNITFNLSWGCYE